MYHHSLTLDLRSLFIPFQRPFLPWTLTLQRIERIARRLVAQNLHRFTMIIIELYIYYCIRNDDTR